MKRQLMVTGILAMLLAVVLMPGVLHATPSIKQPALVQSSLRYEQILTTPDNCPQWQRTLLAVSLAASVTQTSDAADIFGTYLIASEQVLEREKVVTEYAWTDAWLETSRTTNTYDGVGDLTLVLNEDYVLGAWENRDRDLNTYDGSHHLMVSINQVWDGGQWVNSSRETFTYDGSGKLIELVMEQWVNDAWVYYLKSIITYNGVYIHTMLTQLWNGAGSTWDNSYLATYTYDGSNRVSQVVIQSWVGGAWANLSRSTSTYDGPGNLVELLNQTWDSGSWVNSSKNEYVYNGSAQVTLRRFYFWSDPDWTIFEADTSKYSGANLVEEVRVSMPGGFVTSLTRTLYFYNGSDNIIEEIDQSGSLGLAATTWTNQSRTTREYEAGGTAVQISDEPAPAGWELNQNYPNPFNPSTSIRYSLQRTSRVEVTVFNMLGQAVKTLESGVQAPGVYETTWDGTDTNGDAVASGMYLYRISTDDFTETRKMMLLK